MISKNFNNLVVTTFFEGFCILRSHEGKIGRISVENKSIEKWKVIDINSNQVLESFSSIQDLLKAGWSV
ncbi:MAG TPA: hypothetical protein PK079_25385 [Leptospiraceae bacterium]|nr:hypothetical protein [Leptospiraceae bacterium]HMW07317.1 hypothetical protein [Leptospiraceae bacterium]HMX34051.1 hypothetical protein [Leptospiraceae bacterium]HMY32975.1 hypothetical protein [Leptospiraceae bacterium]HMZ67456.1 hypothetical protein [Leptospiraceae bacterium]